MNLARGDKLFYIYSKAIKTYLFPTFAHCKNNLRQQNFWRSEEIKCNFYNINFVFSN